MELIRGLYNLRPRHRGCAATIGAYDGVHLGHQALLQQLEAAARDNRLASALVSFEPLPAEYFRPADPPARLTRFREKFTALDSCGLDRFLCLGFDEALAVWPAEEFIERVLVAGLDAQYVIVGADFRFGHERKGDVYTLRDAARQHGFQLVVAEDFEIDGERVSSTGIRLALAEGRLRDARLMLGRDYRMSGRVIAGDGLGRKLGFATANVSVRRAAIAVQGIFAVRVLGIGDVVRPAVASIGTRPTVNGRQPLLEVHLFDFHGDIYGRYVHVDFVEKLREESRFASLEDMQAQMRADADAAREILGAKAE
ncbi:MAG: bifunctional riboflavin kinase/FAD synthetase [Gammaproteobacteria bacterium]|nr:bifunctional riboflavin kinase/FAD synthetase [Gammaproteobacteria bacterium]